MQHDPKSTEEQYSPAIPDRRRRNEALVTPDSFARGLEPQPLKVGSPDLDGWYASSQQELPSLPPSPPQGAMLDSVSPKQKPPNRRTIGGTLLSILFYLWGMLVYILGIGGLFASAYALSRVARGGIMIGLGMISLMSLTAILILHKHPRLRWGMRLLVELAAMGLGLLTFFISAGVTDAIYGPRSPQVNLTLGIIALVYGLVTMVLALW